ncbi:MAG: class D sortase [Abditibacteriota bacterium]|nr:class D sortase [Abditibacteriota bacterium]
MDYGLAAVSSGGSSGSGDSGYSGAFILPDTGQALPADMIYPASAFEVTGYSVQIGQTVETAYTSVSGMKQSDGSIGTVKIPSLGLTRKVWEGETTDNMAKGMAHYSSTSAWDGNVGLCGHNRGYTYAIGTIRNLKPGDTITYSTVYGTRTYEVVSVETIAENDWSRLQATTDNRLTITTCLANTPSKRVCVQAVEVA